MGFFKQWGQLMTYGANRFAQWEIENANRILHDRKRLIILGLLTLPIIVGGIALADQVGESLPHILGGKRLTVRRFTAPVFLLSRFLSAWAPD